MLPNYICGVGRILAIDYGDRRCGLAVTDPLQIIASPLDTIDANEVLGYLKDYLEKENVDKIILGMPVDMNGSHTATTHKVLDFKEKLTSTFPTKQIIEIDERLTSVMAKRTVVHSVKSKKKRRDKGLLDRVSAAIILESYLQRVKNNL